jgi:hypothetical protein
MFVSIMVAQKLILDNTAPLLQLLALAVLGAIVYVSSLHLIDRSILSGARNLIGELSSVMGLKRTKRRR